VIFTVAALGLDDYLQMIVLLVVFLLVCAATLLTTKWIANFQKQQTRGHNLEVIETMRLTSNKYLQIVRVGEKYLAIAVCKDTVTMLCELQEEQIRLEESENKKSSFRDLLEKAVRGTSPKPKDGE
jgi:flagellar protein FliO/FliZ